MFQFFLISAAFCNFLDSSLKITISKYYLHSTFNHCWGHMYVKRRVFIFYRKCIQDKKKIHIHTQTQLI